MKKKTVQRQKSITFGWVCSWTNGKGCYNPDYEGCSGERKGYGTAIAAAKAGQKHVQRHSWGRWGYPDEANWRDSYVYVVKFYPLRWNQKPWNQKTDSLGKAADVIAAYEKESKT